jgi:hypothetical protein
VGHRYLERETVRRLLEQRGCRFRDAEPAGYETWVGPDGWVFTLALDDGRFYDDEMIRAVIEVTLGGVLPEDWLDLS